MESILKFLFDLRRSDDLNIIQQENEATRFYDEKIDQFLKENIKDYNNAIANLFSDLMTSCIDEYSEIAFKNGVRVGISIINESFSFYSKPQLALNQEYDTFIESYKQNRFRSPKG